LKARCYDCHGGGESKAGLAFDKLTAERIASDPGLWLKVLKNTRAGLMPPLDTNNPLTAAERTTLESWIKTSAFSLDSAHADPGRVTVRRLNRTEYRNTIRDLIGIDFNVEEVLPADDSGFGFDNIGDVLSISPIRMEKYLTAAQAIVDKGVPLDNKSVYSQLALNKDFLSEDGQNGDHLSFYQYQEVSHLFKAKATGDYRVIVQAKVDGEAMPEDPQHALVKFLSEGKEFHRVEHVYADAEYFVTIKTVHWEAGDRRISFSIEPVYPELQPLRTKMEYRIVGVTVEGPLDPKDWDLPENYHRFYSRNAPPPATDTAGRRAYAREVLEKFATRAYRRPVEAATLDRLVAIAELNYATPGTTFERGVAQAMVAVLASPRFLFRIEEAAPAPANEPFPQVDEYTLASRLSYFLWSSMPDAELFALAGKGELRKNLVTQVKRMLADPKAQTLAENFPGQWLQSRSVTETPISAADVLAVEQPAAPAGAAVVAAAETPAPPADAAAGAAPGAFGGRGGAGRGQGRGGRGGFAPADPAAVPGNFAAIPPQAPADPAAGIAPDGQAPDPAAAPVGRGRGGRGNGGLAGRGGARGAANPADPAAVPGNAPGFPPQFDPAAAGAPQLAQAGAPAAGRGAAAGARGARGARGIGGAGAFAGGRGGRGGRGAAAPTGLDLTPELRVSMKQEAEAYFAHIMREDRSVLELIDSDYTFVNDQLAAVYGLPGITGAQLQKVTLPPDNPRGGILTMGGVLTVTSNATRTSPVKRGKWILENILGSPSAPPPPDVPGLEKTQDKLGERKPTQRELIALHRADPLCASCHERMDPLGLALENFNAFGRQRAMEFGQPIDTSGELATGEKITGIKELKKVIIQGHRSEFYHTLTEKLMTYALGRGVEYYDVPTIDAIVARLEKDDGKFSTLLMGVIESAPFQRRRPISNPLPAETKPATLASNQPTP
jgi:hypothetical protein